jgi:hypothetical protein
MPRRKSMKGMGADAFFTPVSQHDSMTVSQPDIQFVKATFYLAPDHIMILEKLRLERIQNGQKIDKSALVREAIEKLTV